MRKLMTFSLSFALSAAIWQVGKLRLWIPVLIAFIIGAVVLRRDRRLYAIILTAGLLTGGVWFTGFDLLVFNPAVSLDGETGEITVRLTDYPTSSDYYTQVEGKLKREGLDIPVLLRLDEIGEELGPGDLIEVEATLYRADESYGDTTWTYISDGIFLRGYAEGEYRVVAHGSNLRYLPQHLAREVKGIIAEIFPTDTVGFITAILTGDRSVMEQGVYSSLRDSGIAHIVAVSGMHVSFLAGLLMGIIGKGKRPFFITMPVILLFVLMTGASPSVVRAGIMQILLLSAPLLGRESDSPTSLGAALIIILLNNPYAIASVSLQLSFLSVAGLCFVTPRLQRYLENLVTAGSKWSQRAIRAVSSSLSATIGATLFTIPGLAFHFGTISVYSPLTNLLVVWAASLVFGAGLFICLVGFVFLPAAKVIALPVALLVRYIQWVAGGVSQFPMAVLYTAGGYIRIWLVVLYAVAALYLFYRGDKPGPGLPAGLLTALLVYCLILGSMETASGDMTVTALNVGQGQSILISTPGANVLVDCGGERSGAAGDIAADYLFANNINSLDILAITHFDADHINGIERLMRTVQVDMLAVPDVPDANGSDRRDRILELAEELGVPVYFVKSNTVYQYGAETLTIYAPLSGGRSNDSGLSFLMTSGEFDVLITGDMDAATERKLVKTGNLPDIEVLVVGHHGSKYSSSQELLADVLAEVAIISVGESNSYGHPTIEAMTRLVEYGAEIYRTDWSGHIVVKAG